MKHLFRRQQQPEAPPRPDQLTPGSQPHVSTHGDSAVMWLGDLKPVADTPPDWMQRDLWLTWEPPLNAIRGESYYQQALRRFAGEGVTVPAVVNLVREPQNPHDPNAIRAEVNGELVGHLARELAALFAPVLDNAGCTSLFVPGVLRTGPELMTGVHVWLWRRLSPGPDLLVPGNLAQAMIVAWPPEEVTADGVSDPFDRLERDIEKAWSAREIERLVALTREAVASLEAYVERTVAESRSSRRALGGLAALPDLTDELRTRLTTPSEDDFPVHHIEAISTGGPVLAALGDREALESLLEMSKSNEHLHRFTPEVEGLLATEGLTATIISFVREHPGAIQKDLHVALEADKAAVSSACYFTAVVGRLQRVKQGVSYSLSLPA
jgi:hypothetical protein